MKKIIVLTITVILLACLGIVAFATGGAAGEKITTPGGKEISLITWDTFDSVPLGDGGDFFWINTSSGSCVAEVKASSNDANAKSVFYTTDPAVGYISSQLRCKHSDGAAYSDFVNNRDENGINAETKAIVYRIKTDSEVLFGLSGDLWNSATTVGCQLAATGDPIWLIDADTSCVSDAQVDVSSPYRNTIVIPKGFDGYLVLPTSRIAPAMKWTGNEHEDPATIGSWNAGDIEGYVYFWNMYTYIQQTGEKAATIEIMDMYVINDALPTLTDADYSADNDHDTADVSVIAYAAMAITGLGALVVAKKR